MSIDTVRVRVSRMLGDWLDSGTGYNDLEGRIIELVRESEGDAHVIRVCAYADVIGDFELELMELLDETLLRQVVQAVAAKAPA